MFFPSTDGVYSFRRLENISWKLILIKGARKFHFEQISTLLEERIHETQLEVDLDAVVLFNFYKSSCSPIPKWFAW